MSAGVCWHLPVLSSFSIQGKATFPAAFKTLCHCLSRPCFHFCFIIKQRKWNTVHLLITFGFTLVYVPFTSLHFLCINNFISASLCHHTSCMFNMVRLLPTNGRTCVPERGALVSLPIRKGQLGNPIFKSCLLRCWNCCHSWSMVVSYVRLFNIHLWRLLACVYRSFLLFILNLFYFLLGDMGKDRGAD